jgi:hypothetical protein
MKFAVFLWKIIFWQVINVLKMLYGGKPCRHEVCTNEDMKWRKWKDIKNRSKHTPNHSYAWGFFHYQVQCNYLPFLLIAEEVVMLFRLSRDTTLHPIWNEWQLLFAYKRNSWHSWRSVGCLWFLYELMCLSEFD